MSFWGFVKKDLSFYKNAYKSEKNFHKKLWILLFPRGFTVDGEDTARRPLSQYYGKLKEQRIQKEKTVFISMLFLLLALTAFLILEKDWMGFAVWLLFAAITVRSGVILRELKKPTKEE